MAPKMTYGNWSEAKTRKEYIDKLLKGSAWSPIEMFADGKNYKRASVEEHPTETGPADYVLFNESRAVAAVEGKKVAVDPQNVLQQADRYARGFKDGKLH